MKAKDRRPIDPLWLYHNINDLIDEDPILVNETITHSRVINRYVEKNRVQP